MKKHIFQRVGQFAMCVTIGVVILLIVRSFLPEAIYTVAPIALVLALIFLVISAAKQSWVKRDP